MLNRSAALIPVLLSVLLPGGHAAGQPTLLGVRANGDLLRIDQHTGEARIVGSSGVPCEAIAGYTTGGGRGGEADVVFIGGGPGVHADQLTFLDRWTGQVLHSLPTSGRPAGYGIRAMAVSASNPYVVYAILGSEQTAASNLLAVIAAGAYTIVGPMGRSDLTGLAIRESGPGGLRALGPSNGGTLYSVDPNTGAVQALGGGGFGGDTRAMVYGPNDQTLWACSQNLLSVDPQTAATTLIGPTGFTDIRGLAVVTYCYADCDWGAPPRLNVSDFICFQTKFAAGDPYANCDASTVPPVLNVNDFTCFLNAWVAGCP